MEQKQKNKDGCRDGKPCCYEETDGSRTFFNPKRIFSKTRTLHKQCKESSVGCCYASRLADGSYGCDDSSTPLNLTLHRKWKPGEITSKPVGEPTLGEKEELCRIDINQCNVERGTVDHTCRYSSLNIDMNVQGLVSGVDNDELPNFGPFGPDNKFKMIKVDGEININMPYTEEERVISRSVDPCDGTREIVFGKYLTTKTKYLFAGVQWCQLTDPDGGLFAEKRTGVVNRKHFGTAISTEKKVEQLRSEGIDCVHPQTGCSLDGELCEANAYFAYESDGPCKLPEQDPPVQETPEMPEDESEGGPETDEKKSLPEEEEENHNGPGIGAN